MKNKFLCQDKFGVRKTGLFGSIVKGREEKSSDIDVLMEFKEGSETFVIKETLKPTIKEDDMLTFDAVVRNLEIIGEAAKHIPARILWCEHKDRLGLPKK